MNLCGQKNSQESVEVNLDPTPISVTYNNPFNKQQTFKNYTNAYNKIYGNANPVVPGQVTHGVCLNLNDQQQTKLLKTVVEYLNQASTALYFSNNRFLSSAAKDLANQLSDQFCIG